MARHIEKCTRARPGNQSWFHLLVQGRYAPQYWLHLRADARASLHDLDVFLRLAWLECCGHMSEFVIGGVSCVSGPLESGDAEGMRGRLSDWLEPGMKFTHAYDFGTTTELELRVAALRQGAPEKRKIVLLARNRPPEIACEGCGSPATVVCSQCQECQPAWFCGACSGRHECGEEMLLPVVNSPRVGQCAYTG